MQLFHCNVVYSIPETPQMAEEASHATSMWIRSTIQSVSHDHMHISPYSCVANQTPLESSWLLPANPMYLVIFLLFSPIV